MDTATDGLPSRVQDWSYCCDPSSTRATSRSRTMPVACGAEPVTPVVPELEELPELLGLLRSDTLDEPPPRADPCDAELPWPAFTMMSANWSGSVSRPRVLIVSWNCWPLGAGCWPIWPAATCTFCWAMAA